jgi:hypothetical protein
MPWFFAIQKPIAVGSAGRIPYSWLYFDLVKYVEKEKTLRAYQIPQKLSELLILSSAKPGDFVGIPFGVRCQNWICVCGQVGSSFLLSLTQFIMRWFVTGYKPGKSIWSIAYKNRWVRIKFLFLAQPWLLWKSDGNINYSKILILLKITILHWDCFFIGVCV